MSPAIAGIDEVGRGCWAGPLVAGAVLLRAPLAGLADSKQLSRRRREALDVLIRAQAAYGLGWVAASEIDALGMTASVRLAFSRALAALGDAYQELVIDGNINYFPDNARARAVVRADASVPAVSAASIIAKVARDRYMAEMSQQYPAYGFAQHVGYGTKQHLQALTTHGICPLHRRSFRPIATLERAG